MTNNALIVDDELAMTTLLSEHLGNMGIKTCTASDGVEALEKIENSNYDFIITDYDMPQMNGYELISKIKDKNKISPKVILMTGKPDNTEYPKARSLSDVHVFKPFTLDKITEIISKLV